MDGWYRTGSLTPPDQPTGDTHHDTARRRSRRAHLLALALGELTGQVLALGDIGTRHGQRPHVTLDVDLDAHLARRGGSLNVPGEPPVLVPSETIGRILCDADLTPILTTPHRPEARDTGGPAAPWTGAPVDGWRDRLLAALRAQTRSMLWLGRTRRTADTRLWTAAVARDRHCIFPDCTVDPSRCEVHHPVPWEHGGTTDPENAALLCVRHHHAVHEGGWIMTPVDGADPLTPRYWRIDPPPTQPW